MKLLLVSIICSFLVTCVVSGTEYVDIGCWINEHPQKIERLTNYQKETDAINKCFDEAANATAGYDFFAVGEGGRCWAGNGDTYKAYGAANTCPPSGKGDFAIVNVYKILPMSTEGYGDYTSTEGYGDYTSTEGYGDYTSTEGYGDYTSTEGYGDYTSTEGYGDYTSTEGYGDYTSTEGYGDYTSTEGYGVYTSTEGYGDYTSTEGYGDYTSTESYGDYTSTEGHSDGYKNGYNKGQDECKQYYGYSSSTDGYGDYTSTDGYGEDCYKKGWDAAVAHYQFNGYSSSTDGYGYSSSTDGYGYSSSTDGYGYSSSTDGYGDYSSTEGYGDGYWNGYYTGWDDCRNEYYGYSSSTDGYVDYTSTDGYGYSSSTDGYGDYTSTDGYVYSSSTDGSGDYREFCREEGTGNFGSVYTPHGKVSGEDACAAKCAEVSECAVYAYTLKSMWCYTWTASSVGTYETRGDSKYNSGYKRGLHSRCPEIGAWFRLETRKGLVLTVPPGPWWKNTHLIVGTPTEGDDNQLWRWSEGRLINKAKGYNADIMHSAKKDGAKVIAYKPTNQKNQQWEMKGGYIYSALNGKVMQISSKGSIVEMWTLQTGEAATKQQWHYDDA